MEFICERPTDALKALGVFISGEVGVESGDDAKMIPEIQITCFLGETRARFGQDGRYREPLYRAVGVVFAESRVQGMTGDVCLGN